MLFRQQPQDAGCGEQHIIDEESRPGVGGIRYQKIMLEEVLPFVFLTVLFNSRPTMKIVRAMSR